jgi:hypothetical protein
MAPVMSFLSVVVAGEWHGSVHSDFGYLSQPLVVRTFSINILLFKNSNKLTLIYKVIISKKFF